MTISLDLIKKLREATGAGVVKCKEILQKVGGDIDKAVSELRKLGAASADKKASRTAAEGKIAIKVKEDGFAAVMLEINSETDFVVRDENFINFSDLTTQLALAHEVESIDDLAKLKTGVNGETIEDARQALIIKIGENIKLRRLVLMQIEEGSTIGSYAHGNRIGVLVHITGGDEALAKDIAMHIAASRPIVVQRDDVPDELVVKEREIYTAQAQASGKPEEIIAKMIEGRVNKFLDEASLLGQPFVKDPGVTVAQLLRNAEAEVVKFVRYEVGEGIEKKTENFAEEVMAQVKGKE
ncbi:MAG: translation elongation factor Ts [Gammaproteobacteria bacterium]